MKKLLYLFLFLALLFGVNRLSHTLTDGFSLSSITSNLPHNASWDVFIEENDLEEMLSALDQDYSYLESGSQSYVFVSEDDRYVLKFFKHKRWRLPPLFDLLPLPTPLEEKRQRWKEKKQETVEATFSSCIASYREFKEETGVFYIHLNPTSHLNKTITIANRLGFQYKIDLDHIHFLLQKKATPTDKYLLLLKKENDHLSAKKALVDLLQLNLYRARKGYSDKDPHLIRNFGFLDGKAVEIDVGGFHRDPKKDLHYFYSHEIYRIQKKILPWLKAHYSELASFAEEQIQEMIQTQNSSNFPDELSPIET